MAHNTVEACDIACRLHDNGKLDESPQDQNTRLPLRRTAKAGLCQSSVFTCFQNAWASQSLSHCTDSASTLRHVLLALGSPLVSYASSAMVFVRHKDFTLRERHRCVELDARMNPTPSHSTTNVLCCTTFLPQYGDRLQCYHGEAIFSTT